MSVYAIGFLKVHDPAWQPEYRARLPAILAAHGGRLLAGGGAQEILEGSPPDSDAVIIIEFPSMDCARAWYSDPEHAPLIALRQTGAILDMLLAPGASA
jgi:uncharacterized protein (DUF1330 family)